MEAYKAFECSELNASDQVFFSIEACHDCYFWRDEVCAKTNTPEGLRKNIWIVPDEEYKETLVKARAIQESLKRYRALCQKD